jgi:hypothetical protein
VLDEPIVPDFKEGETVGGWNPPSNPEMRSIGLLSWTSKMGSPSFSLPAGSTLMGGSCPGAAGGQAVMPKELMLSTARRVREISGRPVRLQQAICNYCYATGGQYATGNVQFIQSLRFIWTAMALADGSFVDTMTWAVQHADYVLDGGAAGTGFYGPERHPGRYFRLHDSGDIFAPSYLRGWKEVANNCPDILFWAPSRAWAQGGGVEMVNEINNPPNNLIIRPSAYCTNEPAPTNLGPGWAAGSTVFTPAEKLTGAVRGGGHGWTYTVITANAKGKYDRDDPEQVMRFNPKDPDDSFMSHLADRDARIEAEFWEELPAPTLVDTILALRPGASFEMTFEPLDDAPILVEVRGGEDEPAFNWDCQAYAATPAPEGTETQGRKVTPHTCRSAVAPDGKVGCRACWRFPDEVVNYTLH